MRALFDIVLKKNNPILAGRFLQICQMFEHQQWYFETPLRQFTSIPYEIISKIEQREISVEKLKEMDFKEIGNDEVKNLNLFHFYSKCIKISFLEVFMLYEICRYFSSTRKNGNSHKEVRRRISNVNISSNSSANY